MGARGHMCHDSKKEALGELKRVRAMGKINK